MKNRILFFGIMVALALLLPFLFKHPEPARPLSIQPKVEDVPSRLYKDNAGHEARVSTPLLDAFQYTGDSNLCSEFKEMTKNAAEAASEFTELCIDLSRGTPIEVSQKRTSMAIAIADNDEEFSFSFPKDDASQDKRVVFGLSALKAALDILPPEEPAAAMEVLNNVWIARNASASFSRYSPSFLFGSAMRVEAGEAMLKLCPLTARPDCNLYVPSGLPGALEELGRWKSDVGLLLRSAELLERENAGVKEPDKRSELKFARDFSSTLGYASEIDPGTNSAHARRGVKPLEDWLLKYESSTDERQLQYIYSSVGAAYGRIAQNTKQNPDAEKALKYNSLTYDIERKLNSGGASWQTMVNLGDDVLLLGELEHDQAGFQRAVKLQRDAFALTEQINSQEYSAYVNMKLARTLQHYAEAGFPDVADAEKINMLEEAIKLAEGVKPLFEKTGATSYLQIINRVLINANAQLAKLHVSTKPKSD